MFLERGCWDEVYAGAVVEMWLLLFDGFCSPVGMKELF